MSKVYWEIRTSSIISAARKEASITALKAVGGIHDKDNYTLLIPIARHEEFKVVVEAIMALEGSTNT